MPARCRSNAKTSPRPRRKNRATGRKNCHRPLLPVPCCLFPSLGPFLVELISNDITYPGSLGNGEIGGRGGEGVKSASGRGFDTPWCLSDTCEAKGRKTYMKNTGTCPKCNGREIITIPPILIYGNTVSAGLFHRVRCSRCVCGHCGYIEEWVEQDDIEKLRKRYSAQSQ